MPDTGDRNNVILDNGCDSTANNEVEEFIEGFDDSFSNRAQLWIPKNDGNGHFVIDRFIEVHNHPMLTEFGKQFLRANRSINVVHRKFVVDAATTNLGSYRARAFFKSLTGSYSEVGATAKDFQNWMRDVKLFIGKRDDDILIEKFKTKKETSNGVFFYEYETDSNGHLT
ncbi:hypothetical protein POM88_022107 [Heracleum sosnowskyi]|uniref:Protein FAR1-RELATED SEQUENCE n=1 Tax=Heracleum sosnowskyi TaxID=360622 RepID=A0AAD8IH81_9APIA|nr:hypothetical protein POM88_022107 [Heracleum sosnowskyi]